MSPSIRSYLAEFVGTFTLVFVGTAVATLQGVYPDVWKDGTGLLAISFAFGFTLMVLVWVLGPVSGCHLNPAVSIPMALSGRMPKGLLPGYLISQFLGGLAASGVLLAILKGLPVYELAKHGLGANGNPQQMSIPSLFGLEVLLTALFLMVIFSTTRRDAIRGFEGWAIGGFLFVAHLIAAQLGDASLNPARSFGPAVVVGGDALAILWLFIVAPPIGGILGWQIFKSLHAE